MLIVGFSTLHMDSTLLGIEVRIQRHYNSLETSLNNLKWEEKEFYRKKEGKSDKERWRKTDKMQKVNWGRTETLRK